MSQTASRPEQTNPAPPAFRDALAELVQIGVTVARLVGRVAEAETALAEAAAQPAAAEGASPLATSLAEAIEADRAAAAAAESRHVVVKRTEAVATAYALVSRGMRLTVQLVEHLDRGWAKGGQADNYHTITPRQIARAVIDAIGRDSEGERPARTGALTERLERPDREAGIGDRPIEQVIAEICRLLGLDPARMTLRSPLPAAIRVAEPATAPAPHAGGHRRDAHPPLRRPDG